MNILAAESDLVPDDHVNNYLAVTLAATSELYRSVFGPHVSLMAWKAIASLADRLPEADAVTVLTLLDGHIHREPNHHRHTDDDHVATVARIYDSHPSLTSRAADHLAQMVLQDFNLGETVRRAVRRSIVDPCQLLDALRPHASSHEAAARILDDYGEQVEESLERVAQRIEAVLNAPPSKPGHFAFGTDLPNVAQRARGLDQQTRDRRPPNEWFEEAAEVDLGARLELAAVEAALTHVDRLPAQAFMSVNVSPATATEPDFGALLLAASGSRIVLELTEHARVESYEPLLAAPDELRGHGVRIALDDAGAGYAGLQHLLRLQPDVIKLDLDLTRGIHADPARRALAGALVGFAREIGATIVAEGIETADDLTTLHALGVAWGQGYYLGRPSRVLADTA